MHITLRKHNRQSLRISEFKKKKNVIYMSKNSLDGRFKE